MNTKRALIINNVNFSEPRTGSDNDADKLKETLETLGCTVDVVNDLEADDININITDHANKEPKCDSFICCILTHGDEGVIRGTDEEEVEIKEISKNLNDKVVHLRGRPKVFFFQACQGKDAKIAQIACVDNLPSTAPPMAMTDMACMKLPPDSDFFYGFASSYGTPAMRLDSGSLYIQALCSIMTQYRHEDLLSMVTRVHNDVAGQAYDTNTGIKGYQQQPQLVSTLRKKVYF